jgi:hypothetical protein
MLKSGQQRPLDFLFDNFYTLAERLVKAITFLNTKSTTDLTKRLQATDSIKGALGLGHAHAREGRPAATECPTMALNY